MLGTLPHRAIYIGVDICTLHSLATLTASSAASIFLISALIWFHHLWLGLPRGRLPLGLDVIALLSWHCSPLLSRGFQHSFWKGFSGQYLVWGWGKEWMNILLKPNVWTPKYPKNIIAQPYSGRNSAQFEYLQSCIMCKIFHVFTKWLSFLELGCFFKS